MNTKKLNSWMKIIYVYFLFGYQLLIYWKNISINIVLWWIAEVAFFRQSLFLCVSFSYNKMIIIVIITVISIKTTTCWAGRRNFRDIFLFFQQKILVCRWIIYLYSHLYSVCWSNIWKYKWIFYLKKERF